MPNPLLPCPFCGSDQISRVTGRTNEGKDWPYIECGTCAAMVEPNWWNQRAAGQQSTQSAGDAEREEEQALDIVRWRARRILARGIGGVDATERDVISTLLKLTAAVWFALDDSEEIEDGKHVIAADHVKAVCDIIDTIDALPDDRPGYTMSPPAKARWALRNIVSEAE